MTINQNKKGSRVERQACKLLEEIDPRIEARRSQQYSGVREDDTSADVLTNLSCIRFEIKGGYNDRELYNKEVRQWVHTCKLETPSNQSWCILWKKDYRDWTIIYEMEGIIVKTHQIKKALRYLLKKHNFQLKKYITNE